MTLHAPHSTTRVLSLAARRIAASRGAIITTSAVAVVAFFNPLATDENSRPAAHHAEQAGNAAAAPKPVIASLEPNLGAILSELTPTFNNTPMRIEAAPTAMVNPASLDGKLVLHDTAVGADGGDILPPRPNASDASATPDWASLDAAFKPRLPDPGPVTLSPSALGHILTNDSAPNIFGAEEMPRTLSIRAIGGESLDSLLLEAGVSEEGRIATLVAFKADSVESTLRAGDRIDIAFEPGGDANRLAGVRLRLAQGRSTQLRWDDRSSQIWARIDAKERRYAALGAIGDKRRSFGEAIGEPPLEHETAGKVLISGVVTTTLSEAANQAGMTPGEAETLADIYRYIVDFERELRKGDRFEVMFDKRSNGDYGDIIYSRLWNAGKEITLYRGEKPDGRIGYFDAEGKTNKRSIMRTPVHGGHITSGYGMRKHPILGYNKMHKGVDFRAPTGTPIMAAGDGVVEYVGWRGSYGRYIRIRHGNGYKTAYAHLSRYRKGLKTGQRIDQGDIIGYSGNTGRSKGAHLHFEILKNKKRINPTKVADFGAKKGLTGKHLAIFQARISEVHRVIADLRGNSKVAQAQ